MKILNFFEYKKISAILIFFVFFVFLGINVGLSGQNRSLFTSVSQPNPASTPAYNPNHPAANQRRDILIEIFETLFPSSVSANFDYDAYQLRQNRPNAVFPPARPVVTHSLSEVRDLINKLFEIIQYYKQVYVQRGGSEWPTDNPSLEAMESSADVVLTVQQAQNALNTLSASLADKQTEREQLKGRAKRIRRDLIPPLPEVNTQIPLINEQKELWEGKYDATVYPLDQIPSREPNTPWPADVNGIPVLNLEEAKAKVAYWSPAAVVSRIDLLAEKYHNLGGDNAFERITDITRADGLPVDSSWRDADTNWPILAATYADERAVPERWLISEAEAQRKLQHWLVKTITLKNEWEKLKGEVGNYYDVASSSPGVRILVWPAERDWGDDFNWLLGDNFGPAFDFSTYWTNIKQSIERMKREILAISQAFKLLYEAQGYTPWATAAADPNKVDDPWPSTFADLNTPGFISLTQAIAKLEYWDSASVKERVISLVELFKDLKGEAGFEEIGDDIASDALTAAQKQPDTPWPISGDATTPISDRLIVARSGDNIAVKLPERIAVGKLQFVLDALNLLKLQFLHLKGNVISHSFLTKSDIPKLPALLFKEPWVLVRDKNAPHIWKIPNWPDPFERALFVDKLIAELKKIIGKIREQFLGWNTEYAQIFGSDIYVQNSKGKAHLPATPWPANDDMTLPQALAKYDYWEPQAVQKRMADWRANYHALKGDFEYGVMNLPAESKLREAKTPWPMQSDAYNAKAPLMLKYYEAKQKWEYWSSVSSNAIIIIVFAVSGGVLGIFVLSLLGWMFFQGRLPHKTKTTKKK